MPPPSTKKYKKSFRTAGEMIRYVEDPLLEIRKRLAALESEVAILKQRNAVTHNAVTRNVTSDVTRNGNAERQRRYRERKKAKIV
jgi:hypothetical protein